MSKQLVDKALVEIDYSAGNKEMTTLAGFSVDKSDPSTPVKTMNRKNRAIGYTHGVPSYDITLTVRELRGTPEVDWNKLLNDKEEFMLLAEHGEDGRRHRYTDCVVNSVSMPFDQDGEHVRTVSVTALDDQVE